jgi:uncharacterized membrane protein YphA (DoxX/SURF4 family)
VLSRRLLGWSYGATSLFGFMAAPTQVNVYAVAGYVVVVTGLTAFLHWAITERTMSANQLIPVALVAAGLPTALAAIFTILGPAGLVIGFVLLVLGGVATTDQVEAYLTAPTGATDTGPATRAEAEGALKRTSLEAMSTSALTTMWSTCGSDLDAVQLRADLLDELERRDPVGVEQWIREGVASRPADYVRDDSLNA